MNRKLNTIMLVDDDVNTNLLHEIIIGEMNVTEEIIIFQNGKEALDFLTTKNAKGVYPQPEIIFLDINMPIMNGWEFIEQYDKLANEQKVKILIAMLTSSINFEDKEKALNSGVVNEFINKPLIELMIEEMVEKYFNE